MGPFARARLGWAEAVAPLSSGATGIVDTETSVNVRVLDVLVFVEGFASIAVMMMVMVMVIRAGHHGRRMLECNVLACERFCFVRCARVRACVSVAMIGRSGAESSAVRKGFAMRTRRSASRCQPSAAVMAAAATQAAAVSAATTTATATARVSAATRAAAGAGAGAG